MAETSSASCGACGGLCGGKGKQTFIDGVWGNNPIAVQVLGICSALAVTSRLETAIVMAGALIFTCTGSNVLVSLLRNYTPGRVRMIAELTIIATFVILFDQFLKAFYWDMSKQLGPYVGLIITNCIVMGRAEAFALQNPPILSAVDGAANGAGYGALLIAIAFIRELLGNGTLLGFRLLSPEWYPANQMMVLAPGAFFTLGLLISIYNALRTPRLPETEEQP